MCGNNGFQPFLGGSVVVDPDSRLGLSQGRFEPNTLLSGLCFLLQAVLLASFDALKAFESVDVARGERENGLQLGSCTFPVLPTREAICEQHANFNIVRICTHKRLHDGNRFGAPAEPVQIQDFSQSLSFASLR